ncbi:MAG TPA: hypothetical protein DEF36_19095 [Desulfotomaculum sp.]|nr:hypothetical protein [Desulfotomaculum sp.]
MNTFSNYKILVLGLGNLLMGDDGIGVLAVEELKKSEWPPGVHILEVGTSVFYYLAEICRAQHLIAVDALSAGGAPGSIYRLDWEDIFCGPEKGAHAISLPGLIKMARAMTGLPGSAAIIGVEPGNLGLGEPLSFAVREALPVILRRVTKEVEKIKRGTLTVR